jgi:pSer/pThr/pTyr-binding forkhead associated (FHA) protein
MGGIFMMDKDKCPYCGAETRPGDNFCLNCGNRLTVTPANVPQQAQPVGDATVTAPEDWAAAAGAQPASSGGWNDEAGETVADPSADLSYSSAPTAQSHNDTIEQPALFALRAEGGDILQEYPLDKLEITIGRAPNSDILLSKDKLTSRRHATVHYEMGHYAVRDERSANGTFVNGQQIDELVPVELHDGDHVGIGEHELIFQVAGSVADHVEELPTVAVSYEPPTYRTQDDDQRTIASSDDYGTSSMDVPAGLSMQTEVDTSSPVPEPVAVAMNGSAPSVVSTLAPTPTPAIPAPVSYASSSPMASTPSFTSESGPAKPYASAATNTSSVAENMPVSSSSSTSATANDTGVNFNRLSNLSQPTLPDMTDLTAALSTLDGQVMSLQQQLNATQEALQAHDAEVAKTANQLRTGVRKVSERMDNTIADVARTREALAWAELLQLMEDVMNNPRDIEYVTKLARKARELNKVFQLHQSVLNTMAECNSLLRSMISEDNR